jgi:hypothetical protein
VTDIRRDKGGTGDPMKDAENKTESSPPSTSRSREESMAESGQDAFGKGGAARNPDRVGQADGGETDSQASPDESQPDARRAAPGGTEEVQNPRSSGTTGLGGESQDSDSVREPGGIEGAGGNS